MARMIRRNKNLYTASGRVETHDSVVNDFHFPPPGRRMINDIHFFWQKPSKFPTGEPASKTSENKSPQANQHFAHAPKTPDNRPSHKLKNIRTPYETP
jgi:hypothetical protein